MIFNENENSISNISKYINMKNNTKLHYNYINKSLPNNEKEILKLKKIIAEKDSIILELHSKLKEFRKDIDLLKNKMVYISENTQSKEFIDDKYLQMQTTQRFQILPFYKNYDLNLNIMESFTSNENNILSKNKFDKNLYDLENNINNDINSKSFFKLTPYKTFTHTSNNFYTKNNNNNNFSNHSNYMNDVKYNSSLFFQRCKILMSDEQYLELLRIIKLFNSKKISKNQTYQQITNYLQKINPELLKEFYNLFIK